MGAGQHMAPGDLQLMRVSDLASELAIKQPGVQHSQVCNAVSSKTPTALRFSRMTTDCAGKGWCAGQHG